MAFRDSSKSRYQWKWKAYLGFSFLVTERGKRNYVRTRQCVDNMMYGSIPLRNYLDLAPRSIVSTWESVDGVEEVTYVWGLTCQMIACFLSQNFKSLQLV